MASAGPSSVGAGVVLAAHLAVIAFNIFGLVVIPIGAWRGWRFVREPGWRLVHLASLGVVAAQAMAGRACFLTTWEDQLGGKATGAPLIMRWVNSVIFWPLPFWAFEAFYVALFAYVVALFWIAPVRGWPLSRRGTT
jgi:hypothetical protein